MLDKIFVSPQVKGIVIISNKHGIYHLPHELPNELRLSFKTKPYLYPTAFSPLGGPLCPHKKKDLEPYEIRKYQEDLKTP